MMQERSELQRIALTPVRRSCIRIVQECKAVELLVRRSRVRGTPQVVVFLLEVLAFGRKPLLIFF